MSLFLSECEKLMFQGFGGPCRLDPQTLKPHAEICSGQVEICELAAESAEEIMETLLSA